MRRISLASGVLPEFDASVVAASAIGAGYSDAGLMVRPQEWERDWESRIRDCVSQGLGILDVEVLWIPEGGQINGDHEFIVDVGNRLGADHLLVVSDEAEPDKLAPALGAIRAGCAVSGMRPCLEFLKITRVQSLNQAQELLQACQEHDFGILIDTLHLQRSGEFSSAGVFDSHLYPYVQLCDGNLYCEPIQERLLEDALDLRCPPGAGELPLGDFLQWLPDDVPLSMEVRSKKLRDGYPDPAARAAALLHQTLAYLGQKEERGNE